MSKYDETLTDIKSRTVFALAADAECGGPDHDLSAGAAFLRSVRDGLVEAVEDGSLVPNEGDGSGRVHEIADGAPDVYTSVKWAEFVDLAAYNEDPSELIENTQDIGAVASVCLYMIAERLCQALLTELAEARNEDEEAAA